MNAPSRNWGDARKPNNGVHLLWYCEAVFQRPVCCALCATAKPQLGLAAHLFNQTIVGIILHHSVEGICDHGQCFEKHMSTFVFTTGLPTRTVVQTEFFTSPF